MIHGLKQGKQKLLSLLIILALLMAPAASFAEPAKSAGGAPAAEVPLSNPGFETELSGWNRWNDNDQWNFAWSDEEKRSGGGSVKTAPTNDAAAAWGSLVSDSIPVEKNTDYEFTVYAKGSKPFQLVADWVHTAIHTPTQDWSAYTLAFNSGDKTELPLIIQNVDALAATSTYFDDVSLTKVAAPEPGADNIITNPGFEAATPLSDWNLWNGSDSTFSVTSEEKRSGASAVRVKPAGEAYKGIYHNDTNVARNEYYSYSVWAKGTGAIQLYVKGLDTQQTITAVNLTPSPDQWTELSVAFGSGSNDKVMFAIQNVESDPVKVTYIDDLSAVPEPQPTIEDELLPLKQYLAQEDQFGPAFLTGAEVTDFPQNESNLSNKLHSPDLVAKHFNSITPGNEGKMPVILNIKEGMPATYANMYYRFDRADKIFDFAKEHGIKIRYTTFAWFAGMDEFVPWFFEDENGEQIDAETLKQRMRDYFDNVMNHFLTKYPGMIYQWDVVNEAIDYGPDSTGAYPVRSTGNQFMQILGEDYMKYAFEYAEEFRDKYATTDADLSSKLYYNDFGMENDEAKADAIFRLVKRMLDAGVPIEGIGMQFHVKLGRITPNWLVGMDQMLTRFEQLGLELSITEYDMSVIDDTDTSVPLDTRLVQQAYATRNIMDVFKKHKQSIKSFTFWGTTDDASWLNNYMGTRDDRGLAFDKDLKAKPMYYAMAGQMDRVPVLPNVTQAIQAELSVRQEPARDWDLARSVSLQGTDDFKATFRTAWKDDRLYVLADVTDVSNQGAADKIDVYVDPDNSKSSERGGDDLHIRLGRDGECVAGELAAGCRVAEKADGTGYVAQFDIPLPASGLVGKSIGFDLKATDGGSATIVWNDTQYKQDTSARNYGTIVLVGSQIATEALRGTPSMQLDNPDPLWSRATPVPIGIKSGTPGASGEFRTLWDAGYLYVLADIHDPFLSKESKDAWVQDSFEIFKDENNRKTTTYEPDDGQYRINYDNEASFNGVKAKAEHLQSVTRLTPDGYQVLAKIKFTDIVPAIGTVIGYDAQINDDADGSATRAGTMNWADATGMGWSSTAVYGNLRLVGAPEQGGGTSSLGTFAPATDTRHVRTVIDDKQWDTRLADAQPGADGIRTVLIDVAGSANTESYTVQLPISRLDASSVTAHVAIRTPIGTVTLRNDMLSGLKIDAASIELRIAPVDPAKYTDELRKKLGGKPVIDVSLIVNGESFEWRHDVAGIVIAIPYEPAGDERAETGNIAVWHMDSEGNPHAVPSGYYSKSAKAVKFVTHHLSEYAVAFVKQTFSDIEGSEARSEIEALASRGVISGTGGGAFHPDRHIKRGDFAMMLVKALGLSAKAESNFTDVEETDYYSEAIAIIRELGISLGTGSNRFNPEQPLRRTDMKTFAKRALPQSEPPSAGSGAYVTREQAASFVQALVESQWTEAE